MFLGFETERVSTSFDERAQKVLLTFWEVVCDCAAMQPASGARHVVVGLFISCGLLSVACGGAGSRSTSVHGAALTDVDGGADGGITIVSALQAKGQAFVDIQARANTGGPITDVFFAIGMNSMVSSMGDACRARHPPPTGGMFPANLFGIGDGDPMYGDMWQYGNWWCGIARDLFMVPQLSGDSRYPRMEDISVVAITVDVGNGDNPTAHWTSSFMAWHDSAVSEYHVDVVDSNEVTTHIREPVAAPFQWGYFLGLGSGMGPWSARKSLHVPLSKWANQRIEIRFTLRNTLDPSYAVIGWPAPISVFQPMAIYGTTDLAMGSVDVDNFHVSNGCDVDPLPPIPPDAQPYEDYAQNHRDTGEGKVEWGPVSKEVTDAYNCLGPKVSAAGGDLGVNSAFRPVSYQWHIWFVHDRWKQLKDNDDPLCADFKRQIEDEERHVHAIVNSGAAPGNAGQHPKGNALDLRVSGISMDEMKDIACTCDLYRPYPPDGSGRNGTIDRPHFEYNVGGVHPCK